MNNFINSLKKEEQVVLELRRYYELFGYKKIKLSKFEDYELYARNKHLLGNEGVLTFTDNNGKLLAMRPDVTLSLLRKTADDSLRNLNKLYYIENIYRHSKESGEFKEINQIGVEFLGAVDDYSNLEVLMLAMHSLEVINEKHLLCVSHLGFLGGLLDELNPDEQVKNELLKNISAKNTHDLERVLRQNDSPEHLVNVFLKIPTLYGGYAETLDRVADCVINPVMERSVQKLRRLYQALQAICKVDKLQLDFSLTANLDYYNGLIFNGYIEHLPHRILAGGRYDKLIQTFGKRKGAIGFAVFLDDLNGYFKTLPHTDVDVLLVYDTLDSADLLKEVKKLTDQGQSVRVECKNTQFDEKAFTYNRKIEL